LSFIALGSLVSCANLATRPTQDEAAFLVLQVDGAFDAGVRHQPSLAVNRFDPVSHAMENSPDGEVLFDLSGVPSSTVAVRVKPGTYVVSRFTVQDHWALCFQESTYSFNVQPRESLFLGEFDARKYSADLQRRMFAAGATRLSGNSSGVYNFVVFHDVPQIIIAQPADTRALQLVESGLTTALPAGSAPLRNAALTATTIANTGSPSIFFPRHCGSIEGTDRP